MGSKNNKNRETPVVTGREWPCIEFSQIDVSKPEAVAEFIGWLCGLPKLGQWPQEATENLHDDEDLLESLWSWQGAPRKRMAKLCWQFLVQNDSKEYFDQYFTYDFGWLTKQVASCSRLLTPIQKKLRWVLEGFQERRQKDHFIGQSAWGEEWLLPPDQSEYIRNQLKCARPDLVEESSNYEDALHYYLLPYLELECTDPGRVYIGNLREHGGAFVWIEDKYGKKYPLARTEFPFQQPPGTCFGWGYYGAGPSELSLSILADSIGGDLQIAKDLKLAFIEEILAKIPWTGNLTLPHKRVLAWLRTKNIKSKELKEAEYRVDALKKEHAEELAEHKERLKQIRQLGGLRMQRFDIVPPGFESALYVDLMYMFERAGWVLHCSRCGQPVACERSPRGNRQRARWVAGQPVYHERCFTEHRRDQKRIYWAERSKQPSFRAAERKRAQKRRKGADAAKGKRPTGRE